MRRETSITSHSPPSHHLTITDRYGATIRGKVVYIQPGAWVSGFFMTHRYRMVESGYLFEGTFEQAKE